MDVKPPKNNEHWLFLVEWLSKSRLTVEVAEL